MWPGYEWLYKYLFYIVQGVCIFMFSWWKYIVYQQEEGLRLKRKQISSTWQLSIWNPSRVWEMHANVTPACWYQDFYGSSIKAALLSSSAS